MGASSSIEWTEATWNPLRGCSRVSAGCVNCYAEGIAYRFSGPGGAFEGLARLVNGHPTWTGEIQLVPELLHEPERWRKPKRVFVNSMSDLFHERVPFEFIAQVFTIMARTRRHTYQVLTKRPARMLEFFAWFDYLSLQRGLDVAWPLPNVWIGVSVENQPAADERIPLLLRVPAAVRWISAEPLIAPVNLEAALCEYDRNGEPSIPRLDSDGTSAIKWVVVGGESGRAARPMHPDWARKLREQCYEAGVAFFFKQWGEWAESTRDAGAETVVGGCSMRRVGKFAAGRLLDGVLHDEYPGQ